MSWVWRSQAFLPAIKPVTLIALLFTIAAMFSLQVGETSDLEPRPKRFHQLAAGELRTASVSRSSMTQKQVRLSARVRARVASLRMAASLRHQMQFDQFPDSVARRETASVRTRQREFPAAETGHVTFDPFETTVGKGGLR